MFRKTNRQQNGNEACQRNDNGAEPVVPTAPQTAATGWLNIQLPSRSPDRNATGSAVAVADERCVRATVVDSASTYPFPF